MITTRDNSSASPLVPTGDATAMLPVRGHKPITVIGTDPIRSTFCEKTLQQAINSRTAPGVTDLVLNPDAHLGYGAPVGCVLVSPTHVYPGPVGVDIKCSMSLLQLNLPADVLADKPSRRAVINAITHRVPTGAGRGQRHALKARHIAIGSARLALTHGATEEVCNAFGIPPHWATRCEDSAHTGHDGTHEALAERLDRHLHAQTLPRLNEQLSQLGSYGGGNHFGECEVVSLTDHARQNPAVAEAFALRDDHIAFLSHCGSRGLGHTLASHQFRALQSHFSTWSIPLPGNDKELVYAPLGTSQADSYLDDMAIGANFATLNHLLINALVLEAFQEVFPGAAGTLVYFISHNIARQEIVDNQPAWVHRKGATRAFPALHHALAGTPFHETGHPILLPGNPRDGSVVMVASEGAAASCYSVNHGAGRRMGRRDAARRLNQKVVDADLDSHDILTNCRTYPIDESPDAYKDFNEVLKSVELAGLAKPVAKLKARFVIKDGDAADD